MLFLLRRGNLWLVLKDVVVPVQQLALIVVAFNAEEAVGRMDAPLVKDAAEAVEIPEDAEETVRVVVLDAKEVAVDVLDLALEAVLEAVLDVREGVLPLVQIIVLEDVKLLVLPLAPMTVLEDVRQDVLVLVQELALQNVPEEHRILMLQI